MLDQGTRNWDAVILWTLPLLFSLTCDARTGDFSLVKNYTVQYARLRDRTFGLQEGGASVEDLILKSEMRYEKGTK